MKRSRIRPVSRNRQQANRTRRRVVASLGAERGPGCELQTPACRGRWDAAHELVGRRQGGSIIDPVNLRLSCNPCNVWVEDQPAYARRTGRKCPKWEAVQGIEGLVPSPDWRSRHGGQA